MYLKNKKELARIKKSAEILSKVHGHIASQIKAGVTTKYLDEVATKYIAKMGAKSSFKGYQGYPASICTSVNEQVIHGIPSDYVLKIGDILAVDCGVLYQAYHSDSAYTYSLGNVDEKVLNLLAVTKQALYKGIEQAIVGHTVGDIGYTINNIAEKAGYQVVKSYGGHGIGQALHEDPYVPNFGKKGRGKNIQEGMVLAIEPMINMGKASTWHRGDGWGVYTLDGKPSAHFEHTIAIVEGMPSILTSYQYIDEALNKHV